MFRVSLLIFIFFFAGCSTDNVSEENTLNTILGLKEIVLDNVISCAASNEDDNLVSVFIHPRVGVTNIRYFETKNDLVDKNDFSKYTLYMYPLIDVFNGYLKKFEVESIKDKWVIVSFDEDGKTHLSNPIHLKKQSKPTEYLPQNILVDLSLRL